MKAARPRRGAALPPTGARVGVIMGSTSDLAVMQAGIDLLAEFEVPHEVAIVSAHRTPLRMMEYAQSARGRGLDVIIAGAGGAAHLPGMTAALTTLPVIGVPVAATLLNGNDALLAIVQMPAGIPVATVAINNATNAALLAIQILAVRDAALAERLAQHRETLAQKVLGADPSAPARRPSRKRPR